MDVKQKQIEGIVEANLGNFIKEFCQQDIRKTLRNDVHAKFFNKKLRYIEKKINRISSQKLISRK